MATGQGESTAARAGRPSAADAEAGTGPVGGRPGGRRPAAKRRLVSELPAQGSVDQVFLATHKQLRPNRNGQLFLQVELADRSGSITGRLWNASTTDTDAFEDGDYVRVEGATQLYAGNLQIIISAIARVDPRTVDEREFAVLGPGDVEALDGELAALLATVPPGDLADLVAEFRADAQLMATFRRSPAGVKQHHAHVGGLLLHVVTLLRLVDRVAPLYPAVDRDLLLVGAFIHDIGKTVELESERGCSYTDVGQLVGHVVLGVEILEEKIQGVQERTGREFDPATAMRLKHMIVSHHGEYEYGAPRLPMTLEAILLHQLDALDARVAGVTQLLEGGAALDGGWTPFQQQLGRKFFKGRG